MIFMHYYLPYFLGPDDDHIINVNDFRADGDVAAIIKAGALIPGASPELWNLGRKVLEFAQ